MLLRLALLVGLTCALAEADARGVPGALAAARLATLLAWPVLAAALYGRPGRWPVLLAAQWMAVAAIGLGLVLLVLPGLYLAVRLAFVDPLVVRDGCPPWRALTLSWERTRPFQGRIAALWAGVLALMAPGMAAAPYLDAAGWVMTTAAVEILSLFLPLCLLAAGIRRMAA